MTPDTMAALDGLRDYLDRVAFNQVYKFIAAVNQYSVTPALVTRTTAPMVDKFFDQVLGGAAEYHLLQCLMTGRSVGIDQLTDVDKALAHRLVAAGLLRLSADGHQIVAAQVQLISAFGLNLMIDRRIHFGGTAHEVYIGPDSFWMLYYIDCAGIKRTDRVVDLCTGSGIASLYLSLFSDHVVATDIGEVPLAFVDMNRHLNRRTGAVSIRREELSTTLNGAEKFDILTCNPPFVAFPPGYDGGLFAQGTGTDGLDYMRAIVDRLPHVLNPGGKAYLVADLVGDETAPYFLNELQSTAFKLGLRVDAFIDHVLPASAQVDALASFLNRVNDIPVGTDLEAEIAAFQTRTLRAARYYLTTLRIQTFASVPGVRTFRRDGTQQRQEWPTMLVS
jgi:methylase of polypeptide subunit release factors